MIKIGIADIFYPELQLKVVIFTAVICSESVESLLLQVGTRLDMMSCFGLARFYSLLAQLRAK